MGCDGCFYGVDDGLCFDEHSGSSAVDLVVHLLVFILAVGSRVDEVGGDQVFFLSFFEQRGIEKRGKEFWEEGDKVEIHGRGKEKG